MSEQKFDPGFGPTPTSQGIRGYRDLTQEQTGLINAIKAKEEEVAALWGLVDRDGFTDPRWLAVARTDFQTAFSALVRSIAQPYDPFEAARQRNQQDQTEEPEVVYRDPVGKIWVEEHSGPGGRIGRGRFEDRS